MRIQSMFRVGVVAALILPSLLHSQTPRARDSAGVRIIENAARSTAPITLALQQKAVWDVGGLKGTPDDELDSWFLGFPVAELSNGSSVVGDRVRVRFFDSTGVQYKVAGREGQGPREFSQTTSICVTRGDTVLVGDRMNGRVSVLDKSGEFVRDIGTPGLEMPPRACFTDGTFLLQQWSSVSGSGSALRLERWRTDGSVAGQLGVFGGSPPTNVWISNAAASVAAVGTRFFVGDPRTSEVRVFDLDGKLVAIVRTDDPIAPVTAQEAGAMQSRFSGAGTGGGGSNRAATSLASRPKPTHWPAYGILRSDPGGRLWIADFRKSSSDPYAWTAFDQDGRMLGKFGMPAQTVIDDPYVLSFTKNGAIVRYRDSNGASHLALYLLEASGRQDSSSIRRMPRR